MGKRLTVLFVKSVKKPGRYSDNLNGLYLQSSKTIKSWIFRYTFNGKRHEMGLGRVENISLAQARKMASDFRNKMKADPLYSPLAERAAEKARAILILNSEKTFEQCAAEYINFKSAEWTNKKHHQQWRNTLSTYAYPVIGNVPVRLITVDHIKKILTPIWTTKTETASRVRNRIEQVLNFALVHKYYQGENPARWTGHLDKVYPAPRKVKKVTHHAAMPYQTMNPFMVQLRSQKVMSAYALEFLILTASRTSPVLMAQWCEIDFKEKVWRVPGHKMKITTDKDFDIPLSDRAIELLTQLSDYRVNDFLFPGTSKTGGLSNGAMDRLLTRMGSEVTVHGFRSTFKDWCSEATNTPNIISEMALAHAIQNNAEAAYRRGDLLEKRRLLMQQWADFLR